MIVIHIYSQSQLIVFIGASIGSTSMALSYFVRNTKSGPELWVTDGSVAGTHGVASFDGAVTNLTSTGSRDFNGDGFSDILFQNTSSGRVTIWEMDGNTRIGGGTPGPSPGTTIGV
jgi:ELWxxDGT repeat protein